MITVTKEFTFDCAHMLSGHEGLCKNLHGHTYKLQVMVRGHIQGIGPSQGMVMDFKDLKETVKEVILDKYDHAFIYHEEGDAPELGVAAILEMNGLRTVRLPHRPTAELMTRTFMWELSKALRPKGILVASIALWETPTSFAVAESEER